MAPRENLLNECPVCKTLVQAKGVGDLDAYSFDCPKCEKFQITRHALHNLKNRFFSDREVATISGWLRENQVFEIHTKNIEFLEQLKIPTFHERADKFLEHLEKETAYAGHFLETNDSWLSSGRCINFEELREIIDFLKETKRVTDSASTMDKIRIKICPAGWAHLETLRKINADQKQCFVAMWFSDEMQEVYDEIISPAILESGYIPHRVDQREHNDKIDDEIIAQIRKSRFVFADFTGHRGGVYFEAGFAKGLGLEVFWSCLENDLKNLHFDIRQYNCITWNKDDLDSFKKSIRNRIEAVIGHGPLKV